MQLAGVAHISFAYGILGISLYIPQANAILISPAGNLYQYICKM